MGDLTEANRGSRETVLSNRQRPTASLVLTGEHKAALKYCYKQYIAHHPYKKSDT